LCAGSRSNSLTEIPFSRLVEQISRISICKDLHPGDFALCQEDRLTAIWLSLNGGVILIRVNHDYSVRVLILTSHESVVPPQIQLTGGNS
jgi:hypothetical protein